VKAYSDRGFTYNYLGQYDKAVEDYSKILKIDPHNAEALNFLSLRAQ
jgi:tetratricopeptide (TPR) repeat protein